MNKTLKKSEWTPRSKAFIIADEDVDGVCSAAIVGKRYNNSACEFEFVNARSLGDALISQIKKIKEHDDPNNLDLFIVDVGINKANITSIEKSALSISQLGVRILYFDSHSNKYKGKNLLTHLVRANVNVFNGKIGVAAASIVQDFLGSPETSRLRLLGALSDRELQLTHRYKTEKTGLRGLQAAVAWGAYKNPDFLEKITRRLIRHPDLDLESDKEVIEYSIKANNHRDNLLRHVHKNGKILQLSETPRILVVTVLDRDDFGKARGTIAGRLAGEWGSAIILITQSVNNNNAYAITIRNSYIHKLDLEIMGQLANTENSGGSKGAYRLTISKDELISFLSKIQLWSRNVVPPWFVKSSSTKSKHPNKSQRSKSKNLRFQKKRKPETKPAKADTIPINKIPNLNTEVIEMQGDDSIEEDILDLSDLDLDN
ncbi:MAG: hypothetical protein HeimC2_20210 [Candidatus Heimdallarchaeota archaeon LC_2]|nr:MAG: hypothetical protein HeimC2_20210 [Candidatus Heimdallarchaeota archaeon LC_2]